MLEYLTFFFLNVSLKILVQVIDWLTTLKQSKPSNVGTVFIDIIIIQSSG